MEVTISLPAIAARKGRYSFELAIRDALVRNENAFVGPLGGACTVHVIEDRSGVELYDDCHGMVRLAIGGRRDIVEEVPFTMDWGRRLLVALIPDGP